MRLIPELISSSPQFINPLKERELDLRGNKIALIENLGSTKNQFDNIDFSDNEIRRIENFPLLDRLKTLFFNNNRINSIDKAVPKALPNLETLILTNNYFKDLEELDLLSNFKNLTNLSLLENLVVKKDNYRLYVIHLCPNLKNLDFKKIRKSERETSQQVFGKIIILDKIERLSPDEVIKIKDAIKNATTLQEVNRLEEALKNQVMPKDLK